MGRKLDLSGLTANEAEHVLQVVQRDMKLRRKEEERLSELRQELDAEGSRCLLLSQQRCFNQRCCIRCCSPFTFLLNPKRQCHDCLYNVCKACRVYSKGDNAWLCSACQKCRLLKTQSLEWFYNNVKNRFKRFGSAKVLKTFYRKHLAEHRALSEITEGSVYEGSVCNEGSICGSDAAFYRQTEEHSMAETLTVALRVAEETIDEAISKAEFETSSQEKQNEAHYLREHRGELVEELAKTIVQKIIRKRKTLAEMRADYVQDWPAEPDADVRHHQSVCDQAFSSLKRQPSLQRAQSAVSLLENDPPHLIKDSPQTSKEEIGGSAMSTWKSVDWLDNAGVSPMLKSLDGNWITLQSTQLSRPSSLMTERKNLVYRASVVSTYEDLGSDNETKAEPDSAWGAALQETHRRIIDSDKTSSPVTGRRNSTDSLITDAEGNWNPRKPLLALLKRKLSAEMERPTSSSRTSMSDVNFNVDLAGQEKEEVDEEEEERELAVHQEVGDSRKLKNKRESTEEAGAYSLLSQDGSKNDNQSQLASDPAAPDTLTSGPTTTDPSGPESNITGQAAYQRDQQLTANLSNSWSGEEEQVDGEGESYSGAHMDAERPGGEEEEEQVWNMEMDEDEDEDEEQEDDEEMKDRLYRLVAQARLTYFTSTDDELDQAGLSEGEWKGDQDEEEEEEEEENEEQKDEKKDNLTYKICQLEKEVRANQFSSTEDELDRVGFMEVGENMGEDEDREEELAVKVCRLADQANADQFSSTEDELDGADRGDDEAPWNLQAESAAQVAQLHGLSSLVSSSQFSSTEDELDGGDEEDTGVNRGGFERGIWGESMGGMWERRESFGDLDVKMFDLRVEPEERPEESGDNFLESRENNVQNNETGVVEKKEETENEGKAKVLREAEEMGAEDVLASHETEVQLEKLPEAEWTAGEEGEVRQAEIRERKEGQEGWETTADSEEEDEEFERVISSMLMMTLEDMGGGALDEGAAESCNRNGEQVDNVKIERESAPEETRSTKDCQSQDENERKESAVGETPAENEAQQEGEARKDKESDAKDHVVTGEAQQTGEEVQVDKREDRGGRVTTEGQLTETLGGDTEGGCDRKETETRNEETKEEKSERVEQSGTSPDEGLLSPGEIQIKSSAVSLRSITTEVLKVLNATEELLQGVEGEPRPSTTSVPTNTDPKKLDQQFSRLEENVYVAAGTVYGLESELNGLEECARAINRDTSDMELSFLEEQVASASAKVQQSELQISDISSRIAALRTAGLNVDTQSCVSRTRTIPVMPVTLTSARQLRRRLPTPPVKEDKET